jgi:hypothetical protein
VLRFGGSAGRTVDVRVRSPRRTHAVAGLLAFDIVVPAWANRPIKVTFAKDIVSVLQRSCDGLKQ